MGLVEPVAGTQRAAPATVRGGGVLMHLITLGNIVGAAVVLTFLYLIGLVVRESIRLNQHTRRRGIPDPTRGYYDED